MDRRKCRSVLKIYMVEVVWLMSGYQRRTKSENFTYWDTAIMNLQVLDALGIRGKIFVLGTSQGGWITVRMALLAPERVCIAFRFEHFVI